MKTFTRSRISMLYVIIIVALLATVSVSNYIASWNMERENDTIVNDSIPILNITNSLLSEAFRKGT